MNNSGLLFCSPHQQLEEGLKFELYSAGNEADLGFSPAFAFSLGRAVNGSAQVTGFAEVTTTSSRIGFFYSLAGGHGDSWGSSWRQLQRRVEH